MYKTANIKYFLKYHHYNGSPENLMKRLCSNLCKQLPLKKIDIKTRLQYLSSMQGIDPQPLYSEINENISGYRSIDKMGRKKITLNSLHSEGRRLFSWAHEICHSFFPGKPKKDLNLGYWAEGENPEVEKLCDLGAAEILFFGLDVEKMSFEMNTLNYIKSKNSASKESIAVFMAKSRYWSGGMAIWVKTLKKSQSKAQMSLLSINPNQPKYRVLYSIYPGGVFLPKWKSADNQDFFHEVEKKHGFAVGFIKCIFKKKEVKLNAEAIYLGHQRILTLILNR
jgi:Zn-dependent peptidase ImmA (M78 family)